MFFLFVTATRLSSVRRNDVEGELRIVSLHNHGWWCIVIQSDIAALSLVVESGLRSDGPFIIEIPPLLSRMTVPDAALSPRDRLPTGAAC